LTATPKSVLRGMNQLNLTVEAIVLGIVEGLTEFLPVSSTAHIRIVQGLLQQDISDEFWKMFAIVIQLGAILAVVVYFWQRLRGFVVSFAHDRQSGGAWWKHPLALVLISFVVTAAPCFLIDKKIGENLENFKIMAIALVVGGLVMWWIDHYFSRNPRVHRLEEMTLRQAIVIGLAQILAAAFPGTSRSMATIAGGQIMGLSRPAALEFSFFLSIPVMFAATGYKLCRFILEDANRVTGTNWQLLAIGFGVSFFVALVVIAGFMKWVNRHGFLPFALYRIVAGLALLAWTR